LRHGSYEQMGIKRSLMQELKRYTVANIRLVSLNDIFKDGYHITVLSRSDQHTVDMR